MAQRLIRCLALPAGFAGLPPYAHLPARGAPSHLLWRTSEMPALFTQRRRQRLERVVQMDASSIPQPRPRFPWRLLVVGALVGVGLAVLPKLAVLPAAGPAPTDSCREPSFKLPLAGSADMEPRLTAKQWREFQRSAGPQLPRPPAPPEPSSQSEPAC